MSTYRGGDDKSCLCKKLAQATGDKQLQPSQLKHIKSINSYGVNESIPVIKRAKRSGGCAILSRICSS